MNVCLICNGRRIKKAARDKVESCTSMNDFENIIDGVLEKLHNGHTQRIQDTQSLMYTMKLYEQSFAKQPRDYRYQMIKKLKTKAVYEHYGFDEKQFCDYVLPNAATDENVTVNAKALLLDGRLCISAFLKCYLWKRVKKMKKCSPPF